MIVKKFCIHLPWTSKKLIPSVSTIKSNRIWMIMQPRSMSCMCRGCSYLSRCCWDIEFDLHLILCDHALWAHCIVRNSLLLCIWRVALDGVGCAAGCWRWRLTELSAHWPPHWGRGSHKQFENSKSIYVVGLFDQRELNTCYKLRKNKTRPGFNVSGSHPCAPIHMHHWEYN